MVAPRLPADRRDRDGSADDPSSRTLRHSAGRTWGQHNGCASGDFPSDVGVVDSSLSSVVKGLWQ